MRDRPWVGSWVGAACAVWLHVSTPSVAFGAESDPADEAKGSDQVWQWVRRRAEEHRSYAEAQRAAAAPTGVLYRERPRGRKAEKLPTGFIPPASLSPLIRAVRPAVVNISVSAAGSGGAGTPATGAREAGSVGSGFIISPEGFVVTNNHVVDRAKDIRIRLTDGRELGAEVIGQDPSTDLALLRLKGELREALPFAYLGDSDALEVGDWVVAIGNPFGLDHSVSHGMISAKERVIGVGVFDDFIQTDALVNPGNSGGPLFNMRGEVVGVNTAVVSRGQGIGFAVPVNMVKELLPNLRVNGRLERGWLGVVVHEQPFGARGSGKGGVPERGAVVQEVFRSSPAANAGLRPGDRVLSVNDKPIESYLQLLRKVALLAPGSEASFTVAREGKLKELKVTLGERPAPEMLKVQGNGEPTVPLGVLVQDVTEQVTGATGIKPGTGAYVAGVVPGSAAEGAGLRAGDLITEINRKKVKDRGEYQATLEAADPDKDVLVRFQRGDSAKYVILKR